MGKGPNKPDSISVTQPLRAKAQNSQPSYLSRGCGASCESVVDDLTSIPLVPIVHVAMI